MRDFETGRSGSIWKYYKDDQVRDIMRDYFNHPVWAMKAGETVPDMPLDVQFEFVNRCNLHCSSCPVDDQTRGKTMLDWPVMERLVEEAAHEGVCYLTVCGLGEASLHPDLFRFFAHVRKQKVEKRGLRIMPYMPTVLISNGMWSTAQINACLDNPPDLISFSLAGLNDEEFNERRVGIRMERFRHVLRRLYTERHRRRDIDGGYSPTIHLSTHIFPHEMETRVADIERFLDEWFEMADIVVIKPTMIRDDKAPAETFAEHQSLLHDASKLRYTRLEGAVFERTAPCFETSRRLSINSDGNVWCGHHMSEGFGGYLGNVQTQTLREIWHSDLMNQFRREVRAGIFLRDACKTCGGEIRDFHREGEPQMEDKIQFATP